jgi:hypothetical protein
LLNRSRFSLPRVGNWPMAFSVEISCRLMLSAIRGNEETAYYQRLVAFFCCRPEQQPQQGRPQPMAVP